jgi:hypothetical protein
VWAAPSRRARDAPAAAHSWAARRVPSASGGRGGRSCSAGGTAHARPAALVTRRRRHTHMPHDARPLPVQAGEGDRVARAAQHVLVPPSLQHTAGGTHTGRTARAPSASAGWGGRSRRAGGTVRARPAAIVKLNQGQIHGQHCACLPPPPAGEGGRRARCAGGTACARPAAIAIPHQRHTHTGRTAR